MAAFVENQLYIKVGAKPKGKLRALLWPVLVHRVIYPEMQKRKMNMFQRAVLALLRARVSSVSELANFTGLHEDLIRLVMSQCQASNWLDQDGKSVTPEGERMLDELDEDATELKSGYVFQDALTGRFWPRFSTSLHELEILNPADKFPKFIESRQSGRVIKPVLVREKKNNTPDIDISSLMHAYRDYKDDFNAMRQLGETAEYLPQIKLSSIQSVDIHPKSARVLVWLSASEQHEQPFYVQDPFELRHQAWWLQDALSEAVKSDQVLLRTISEVVNKPIWEKQTVDEWLLALRQHASIKVLAEYPWLDSYSDISRYLAVVLEWNEKLCAYSPAQNELESAVLDCQKLLEVFFQWMIKRYPADKKIFPNNPRNDWDVNAAALNALAIPSFSEGVIETLKRIPVNKLHKVVLKPGESLKTLVVAAAFGGGSFTDHPLRALSAEQLQLMTLLTLANVRNDSGHATSEYSPRKTEQLSKQTVNEYVRYSLDFIKLFKDWM